MKRIFLLVLAGIMLGSAGFCDERVGEPPQTVPANQDEQPASSPAQPEEALPEAETNAESPAEPSEIPQDTEAQDSEYKDIEDSDIPEIYRSLDVPDFRYVHDLDPEEYIDTQNAAWSPYSLFRLTAPLYFKTITIQPGYYLLTPREHAGNWYMLFKEAGKVKYIVPIYDKKIVPMDFYKDHLPEEKTTWSQRQHLRLLKFVGKFKSSQRPEKPKTYLEAEDLDDNFIVIILYWGDYKYYMVLRSVPM